MISSNYNLTGNNWNAALPSDKHPGDQDDDVEKQKRSKQIGIKRNGKSQINSTAFKAAKNQYRSNVK